MILLFISFLLHILTENIYIEIDREDLRKIKCLSDRCLGNLFSNFDKSIVLLYEYIERNGINDICVSGTNLIPNFKASYPCINIFL